MLVELLSVPSGLVVITIMPCTDTCFCSLSMWILFNGISQVVLRYISKNPVVFGKYLSSRFQSGLNWMVLCSIVFCCLLVKRRNPFRSFSVFNHSLFSLFSITHSSPFFSITHSLFAITHFSPFCNHSLSPLFATITHLSLRFSCEF